MPQLDITPTLAATSEASAAIGTAYERYAVRFREITGRSLSRFLARDWRGVVQDARERLGLYRRAVDEAAAALAEVLASRAGALDVWRAIRAHHALALGERYDADLAQTFFNSVARRFLGGEVSAVKYQAADAPTSETTGDEPPWRAYQAAGGMEEMVSTILADTALGGHFEDLKRDALLVGDRIQTFLRSALCSDQFDGVDVVRQLFFRNKAAFIVGRLRLDHVVVPLVLLLRHGDRGVHVQAVLIEEAKAGRLFSNTRSNFHVDVSEHRALVAFLASTLPDKHEFEFYAGIGHFHHARTKLYDDLFAHLERTGERFTTAPGARGKVMAVFSLPTFPMVFKVIRDVFEPPKTVTRADVVRRYQIVRIADRAGRMLDALTFGDLTFRRSEFEAPILRELLESCASQVVQEGARITIRQLYAQRRVTPLPELFRGTKNLRVHRDAIIDYGYLIKDLATVNIFLGDYLLKNFGVTSYGRVVSFDYDELDLITNQVFRAWPQARDDDEELLGSHIESMVVADNDVFPEEFERLLGIPRYLMPAFRSVHADLFTPEYFREIQRRLVAEEVMDITSAVALNLQTAVSDY